MIRDHDSGFAFPPFLLLKVETHPSNEIRNLETYGEMYGSLNHLLMSSLMNVNITSFRPSIIP